MKYFTLQCDRQAVYWLSFDRILDKDNNMSFVYAINDVLFSILSDTKIVLDENLVGQWNTEDERHLVKQIGLMKSVIVSPNMVICYAGNNIDNAAELLRKVKNSSCNLDEIISAAFEIHSTSGKDAIEFIIAYGDSVRRELVSIKDHQIYRNCKEAWLGSFEAYKEFRRLESEISTDDVKGKKSITYTDDGKFVEEDIDENIIRSYKKEECFSKVVYSGCDSSVGGMPVRIRWMEYEDTFQYMEGIIAVSSNWLQILKPGDSIEFLQGADKGSFCCNVYQSSRNYCCYVYENECGIVFTDDVVYDLGLEGMKFPKLFKIDKKSFDEIAKQNGAHSNIGFQ